MIETSFICAVTIAIAVVFVACIRRAGPGDAIPARATLIAIASAVPTGAIALPLAKEIAMALGRSLLIDFRIEVHIVSVIVGITIVILASVSMSAAMYAVAICAKKVASKAAVDPQD